MKTLFDLCEPRSDVLQLNIKESEFAADLAQVLRGKAPPEYQDAAMFFANTHPTEGLQRLLDNVWRRLSGKGGEASAIFRLDTQYGGGKTHALIALAHRRQRCPRCCQHRRVPRPGLLPTAVRFASPRSTARTRTRSTAGIMGDGIRAFTPWGELAYALGKT